MAKNEDILNSLLTQPTYTVRDVNTENSVERLHRENMTQKELGKRINDAVKQTLKFGVTIPSTLIQKDSRD